jgi:hypothetical protein
MGPPSDWTQKPAATCRDSEGQGNRWERSPKNRWSIHETENDMQEITDHLAAGVAHKEMEADKVDVAAQESLNGERSGERNTEIEIKLEGKTWRSRTVEYLESLLATLLAWAALSVLGLFFFLVRVWSVCSGGRKISKSPTAQMI